MNIFLNISLLEALLLASKYALFFLRGKRRQGRDANHLPPQLRAGVKYVELYIRAPNTSFAAQFP
jgi:hypothetical protein